MSPEQPMARPSLVWFRNDLRIDDHPALRAAIERGEPVIPIFIWTPEDEGNWPLGAASRWWLHQSLLQLTEQLEGIRSKLIIREGKTALTELLALIEQTGAGGVYWTRRYEPACIERDKRIKVELRQRNLIAESFNGQLLFEPWEIQSKEGRPYQVFTAFWKCCLARHEPDEPEPAPRTLLAPAHWPKTLKVAELKLEPTLRWDLGLASNWKPGATSAKYQLQQFVDSTIGDYDSSRDQPSIAGTSRLSPYLHFGDISPRSIWHQIRKAYERHPQDQIPSGANTFLKELGWREFAHHLLFHFPSTPTNPLRPEFSQFPWIDDQKSLRAWQHGQTGYPIVDAGMRELWSTGWMHNRVRMIVASFLVKDLLVSWQQGAAWFWDTLVDADLANNTLGWQWTAGCGADAAPYFRVFNPELQSAKFDSDGVYIRRWVPELADLPTKWIHAPFKAPESVLSAASVQLGKTYPKPIVDHAQARERALRAFKSLKFSNMETP